MPPAGSEPLATDQVKGAVPSFTVRSRLYATPTSPDGGLGKERLGDALGTTAGEVADGGPVPAAFWAATVKV